MIRSNSSGGILVTANGKSYDLAVSEQYADFLLWITSPKRNVTITTDTFAIAEGLPDDEKGKAERYAAFLTDFVAKREAKLNEMDRMPEPEQRENAINAFIDKLKNAAQ